MGKKRCLSLLMVLVLSFVLSGPPPSAYAYFTDFEGYAHGTPAEALAVPGMTFVPASPGDWVIGHPASFVSMSGDQLENGPPTPLQIVFDTPQPQISFKFGSAIPYLPVAVEGFLAGTSVFSASFSGDYLPGGTFTEGVAEVLGITFDTIVISAPDLLAIDDLSTDLGDEEEEVEAVPGCDALIQIPESAVGGAFVADAPLHWAPDANANTGVVIGAGNTAWVIGPDATGAYYKVLWQCQFLWVPAETLGPNYDKVWNGTPLPTDVVE